MDNGHGERIATLEEQNKQLAVNVKDLDESIRLLTETIGNMDKKLTGWKGVAVGASLVVSVLWAGVFGIKQFFT